MSAVPAVTDDDARLDRELFDAHAGRRYHQRPGDVGGVWLVRRRGGGTLLRTFAPTLPPGLPDDDEALRRAWFAAAWPGLTPKTRDRLIKAARTAERAKKATKRAKSAPGRRKRIAADRTSDPLTDDIDIPNGGTP